MKIGVCPYFIYPPQAKGKIERPYRWIQDRLVRACYRKKVSDIKQAQLVLNSLIQRYNYKWIHSTTGEVPYIRFQRALKENKPQSQAKFQSKSQTFFHSCKTKKVNNPPAKQVALRGL